MEITVRKMLDFEFLEGSRLIAGNSGLDKTIKYVDIIEVPDIDKWVRQGGVFLTTGYAIKGVEVQRKLVNSLVNSDAAALCIKKGRYFKHIPEIIQDLGKKHGLPIIEVPKHIPYKDIFVPLLSKILEKQTYILKKSENIHQKLTRVVLKGGGLDLLIQTLYQLISRPVLIQDRKLGILALVGNKREEKLIKENLNFPKNKLLNKFGMQKKPIRIKNEDNEFSRVISPIVVAERVLGYVSVYEIGFKKLKDIDFRAVQHAATVVALEMLKEKERLETEKRLKSDLIEDLLNQNYNSPENFIQRAHYLGWKFEREYIVMIVDIENLREGYQTSVKDNKEQFIQLKKKIKSIVCKQLMVLNKQEIVMYKGNKLVIFFDCEELIRYEISNRAKKFAQRIKKEINHKLPETNFKIGIGSFYGEIINLKKSYDEARKAIEIGRAVKKDDDIYVYKDFGIYQLLFKYRNDQEVKEFCQKLLGPVREDKEMIKTIEVLIRHFGNKTRAAEELCIHRNSLNYRINKLSRIMNNETLNGEDWLNLYLAIKIDRLNGKNCVK